MPAQPLKHAATSINTSINTGMEREFVSFIQENTPIASGLTHAVDILAFVGEQEIPSHYFDTPYYLAPAPGGEKDYALLRETLRRTRKIGIAYIVIQARQHLAALVPHGQSLVLNTLRWNAEQHERADRLDAALSVNEEYAGPFGHGGALPLQQMRVTGCDDVECDDEDEPYAAPEFDSDELFGAYLHPRRHETVPLAGRSTTAYQPRGRVRARRFVRRA